MTETSRGFTHLRPPPRGVPLSVRAHLWANTGTVVGALLFAVAGAVATAGLLALDLPGQARLAQGAHEARALVVKVEPTSTRLGGRRVVRYRFMFRTPDRVVHEGASYALVAPGRRAGRPGSTVEYAPDHPEVARLKGTRLGPGTPWLPLVAGVVALGGLVVLGTNLAAARADARLLATGRPTDATLVACEVSSGTGRKRTLSFAEYRDLVARGGLDPLLDPGAVGGALGMDALRFTRLFMTVWVSAAAVIMAFGTGFLVVMIAMLLGGQLGAGKLNGRPASREEMAVFFGLFLLLFAGVGAFMIRSGLRQRRRLAGADLPSTWGAGGGPGAGRVSWTFEYRPPGHPGPARGTAALTLGPDATPGTTALYDPDRPDHALLVAALPPGVRVSKSGDWAADRAARPWATLALAASALVAGPLLGWAAWTFIPA